MPSTRPRTSLSTPLSPPITPSPPQSPTLQLRNPRPSFNIRELDAGCIVWLPSKDLHSDSSSSSDGSDNGRRSIRCIRTSCCGNTALEEEGYNHPVVVLKTSKYYSGNKICLVAIITSKNHNDRVDRLPISQEAPPTSPHTTTSNINGTTTTELYLENSATMHKQSYVLLRHIFQLRASHLRSGSFRAGSGATDTRLREESYARLMSRLCLQRGAWITTAAICEVGASNPGSSPRSRAAEGTRRAQRSRVARGGRRYADASAVAGTQRQSLPQPRTPQSAQVERAVRQVPSRSAAAVEAGVASPSYMSRTQHYPLFGRGVAPSMPGAWDDAEVRAGGGSGGMRGHGYGTAYDQGERFERWQSEPPSGEEGESRAGLYFKVVVVLLAVVGVLWWRR